LRDLLVGVRAGVSRVGDERLDAAPHHDELAGPGRRRARFPRARGRAGATPVGKCGFFLAVLLESRPGRPAPGLAPPRAN
jgi:hypothetical protein